MKAYVDYWKTNDGTALSPEYMDTQHLHNALNWCMRRAQHVLMQRTIELYGEAFKGVHRDEYFWERIREAQQCARNCNNTEFLRLLCLTHWPITRQMEREYLWRTQPRTPRFTNAQNDLHYVFRDDPNDELHFKDCTCNAGWPLVV